MVESSVRMVHIPVKNYHFVITLSLFLLTAIGGILFFMIPLTVTKGDTYEPVVPVAAKKQHGKYVLIHLDAMSVELKNNETVLLTLPVLSQGKPGSYYETIGGIYQSDYKKELHFSSIGHVYMPYSVHIFGNYFIHGIPYYPNGDPVSSAYSGGCVRLRTDDAKKVYDFIETGTPIVVVRGSEESFNPTTLNASSSFFGSILMTNLMIATISLETLTQDSPITDTDGVITTRKTILSRLLQNGDTTVAQLYAQTMGEEQFVQLMNKKAVSIGMTQTHFTDLTSPVLTSYEDFERFMTYISTYKSYLFRVQNADSR